MITEIEAPKIKEKIINASQSKFEIEPFNPGYGTTLGSALRRVLLSSLSGTAISSVKLEGIAHEFSAIPHVKEDMVEIIMNLRKINFKSHSTEPVTVEISAKGPKTISASDIKSSANVEILNPEQYIATLDKSANFNLEIVLEHGRGFRPTEDREVGKTDIGRINVDSVFSPVKLVNFEVEHTRVGQMTNFDKIILEVVTNGTISPRDALTQAAKILVQHFNFIAEGKPYDENASAEEELPVAGITNEKLQVYDPKTKIEDLNLSARSVNALSNAGIKTIAGLKRMSDLKLSEIKGLGKKGFDEIKLMLK